MIGFWDAAIVLLSQVSSFTLGWLFFMKQLFNDYEIHQSIIKIAFSVTFSFSCAMFELIIFEILDVLSTDTSRLGHSDHRDAMAHFHLPVLEDRRQLSNTQCEEQNFFDRASDTQDRHTRSTIAHSARMRKCICWPKT